MDFALWGSFHIRTAKSFRCRGLIVGPGNSLIEQELKGPPDFDHWPTSWEVFQCGMISANACIPPHLIAYHTMIKGFASLYGEKCWPLLYQQDVRFRQEEMPELLYRETRKLEASIENCTWKQGIGLDTDKPWNHCWSLLLTPEVKAWWAENFKDYTTLIRTGVSSVSQFLAGDAKVKNKSSGLPSASSCDMLHDIDNKPQRTPKHEKPQKLTPCKAFNAGHCSGEAGKTCPNNKSLVHKCSHCTSSKHSVLDCPQRQAKKKAANAHQQAPWSKKPNKGGGKGGGKQGRGEW